ncbi:hypothetical protein GCM10011371_25570 [Novosphingobium marinum]|uniref:Phenylpropionate dioxygenase-like ring-hydroxylating dioxygenase large terminal subunit n=1 Tax=Novosphingobium marinum TaxID=1514948 RepID=A0A7Y9XXC2_9SPHN|nr:aromatic ring-hydroxylating dioxygenase subunit alpha [Novosphingobium marinum]NYH94828.1 phenylpropionate dioxygenase-like ring-hydroxylating dioxygenase large terminal subunit [Novosphingobium marinum]GGC37040.1 hypothetical protein GCM10011371_25570 [Novosphingobium marinum]
MAQTLSEEAYRKPDNPTTQDILHRDGRPVHPVFEVEAPKFLGDEDIDFARYTSREFMEREFTHLWPRVWQWACREEHIPEPGDYYLYEIGRKSVIVLRDNEDRIRAYVNSCLHRGTKLRSGHREGSTAQLSCPFHGWTWSLEGELTKVPCAWDAPHIRDRDFRLPELKVGLWGGFVFINFDRDAPPLEEYIDPLPEHFLNFDMENRFVEIHIEKELFCNWKAAKEAFIENYHTQTTHPELLAAAYDEPTQYDILGKHVSRFLNAFGVSSPHLDKPLTERELLDTMLVGDRDKLVKASAGEDGETARTIMARTLRAALGEAYGNDLSRFTDTEIIDVSQYGLFPNMIIYPQFTLPVAYRFRPIGRDPDRSLFELMMLRQVPDDGPRPEPAEPVRLKEDESFSKVPGFDRTLAHVFDQDTDNVRAQQEGFYASEKGAQTLLNYQEVRVRYLEQTVDEYLAG